MYDLIIAIEITIINVFKSKLGATTWYVVPNDIFFRLYSHHGYSMKHAFITCLLALDVK